METQSKKVNPTKGLMFISIEPKDQQLLKLRDILEEQGWRLRLSDVRQLYAGVIQVAQGDE